MSGFRQLDSAEAKAEAMGLLPDTRLAEKLRQCVATTASFLQTALPEISNPGEVTSPPVVSFLRLRIVPGKMEEYLDLYKTEVLPALKKADSKIFAASRRLGTDGYDLTFETPLASFAELDAPPALIRVLGAETVSRITAKLNPLATVVENTILVRQSDLNY